MMCAILGTTLLGQPLKSKEGTELDKRDPLCIPTIYSGSLCEHHKPVLV